MRAHRLVRTGRRARLALMVPAAAAVFLLVATSPAFASSTTTGAAATAATARSTMTRAHAFAPPAPATAATASTAPAAPALATTSTPSPAGGVHTEIFYPTLTVTPSTGLVSGQRVAVTGRGPAAVAAQCTVQGLCDNTTSTSVTPDAHGAFTFSMVVRRFLRLGATTVDCAQPARCRVQTQQFGTAPALVEAWAPITFSSAAPAPMTVAVTPASALVDLQAVHVQASGFLPGALLTVEQCGPDGILCTGVNAPSDLKADAAGKISTTAFVHRTLTGFNTSYDCASGSCDLQVQSFDGDVATAPVAFDAAPPQRPPVAVTVTPSGNLAGNQAVALHAVGFAPGDSVSVEECTVPNDAHYGPFCETLANVGVPVPGVADLTVTVTDSVPTIVPGVSQPCGTTQCEIVVTSHAAPLDNVHVPIAFGGPVPPPPPAVTMVVAPDTGLVDRQAVTVSGDNLDPARLDSLPTLTQCVIGVPQFACSVGTADALLLPDPTGHYTTTFRVSRVVAGLDGTPYDCAGAPGRCALTFDGGPPLVALTFDPSTPPAPPPAAQLSPAGPLADRTTATVHATGFVPGSSVSATECAASTCDVNGQIVTTADGTGAVTVDLQVFRFFDDFLTGRVDCTTGCSIRLDDHTANGVTLPLTFDPRLPLAAPHPDISVARAGALVGGGDTVVRGNGFGPFSVSIGECPAGVTNLDRCDALDQAVTDGSGSFTITTGTKAVLDTPTGPLDCRSGFGTCVYAAWDGHDLFTAPIGFVAGSPTGVLGDTNAPGGSGPPPTTSPGSAGAGAASTGVHVRGASLAAPAGSGSSETLPFTGAAPAGMLRLGLAMVLAGTAALTIGRPAGRVRGARRSRRGGRRPRV